VNSALDDRATAGDLVLRQSIADSRRISRILRMDRASSRPKLILLWIKQNQIALFESSAPRSRSDPTAIAIPNSSRSAVPNSGDSLIVIRPERTIAITSERRFSSARNNNFHGSESAVRPNASTRAERCFSASYCGAGRRAIGQRRLESAARGRHT